MLKKTHPLEMCCKILTLFTKKCFPTLYVTNLDDAEKMGGLKAQ